MVTGLPANTPHDASLYLVGTFNNWQPADGSHQFRRQADGTYQVTVRSGLPELEYKVCRGDWSSVEGNEHGEVRMNRHTTRAEARAGTVEVRIRSWEDLAGTFQFYSLYDLLLLFSCFQGVLLLIAIPSIQAANRAANRWLLGILGLSAGVTLLKVVSGYRDVANAYPTLLLVSDFIWFIYGPLFYFYLRRLLFDSRLPTRQWVYHFIPAGVQLLVYLPYFLLDGYDFQLKLVSHDMLLRGVLLGAGLAAFGSNVAYWLTCRRMIRAYTREYQANASAEQNLDYLSTVLGIQAVCLGLWAFLFVLVLASGLVPFDVYSLANRNVDLIWLAFSTIAYFLGYMAIHQPEIFKVAGPRVAPAHTLNAAVEPAAVILPKPVPLVRPGSPTAALTPRPAPDPNPELVVLQGSVRHYMQQHRPYISPTLTLHELAVGLHLAPHVLSRAINDGFGQSFFDFINTYRVEAFKRRMEAPGARRFTMLSLAFEVGFNSKTAFNRAFKKQTGQTPREHFSSMGEAQEP